MTEYTLVTGEPAELLLDLGEFPVAHKFVQPNATLPEQRFPLRIGVGKTSHLVGLIDPPPWQALTPIYPWIVCNEPEDHLDELAKQVHASLPTDAKILGLSDKDRTFLERLEQLNGSINEEIPLFSHAMLNDYVKPGVEVVQAAMSLSSSQPLPETEQYDFIVGRHILEHTSDTQAFLARLSGMLKKGGRALLEVPDNEKAFESGQHTVIWEEHSLYFTEHTLQTLLRENGLSILQMQRYPMALEDILVVTVGRTDFSSDSVGELIVDDKQAKREDTLESLLPKQFATVFEAKKLLFQAKLHTYQQRFGNVAILGAGHLGAAFVNFYDVGEYIDAVIDDDPNKQGLLLPGCQLPIIGSDALNNGEYSVCLLTCNPWNNEKVAQRNRGFLNAGGQFFSVFDVEAWP